jgi:hypothetical protein
MEARLTTTELLDRIQTARADWDSVLAMIAEECMTQPGVVGDWSVKDMIAHITWFERELVGVLQARALVSCDLWNMSQAERNAAVYEANRHRSLSDVRAEAQQVYQQLLAAIQTLTDDDLHDPRHCANMPTEWLPWQLLADNSYNHYADHSAKLLAWHDQACMAF